MQSLIARAAGWGTLAGALLCAGMTCAQVDNPRLDLPRSGIGRPVGVGPVVCAYGGAGALLRGGGLREDFGVALLLPPALAADFLDPLYDWNTALVLQADEVGLGDGGRVLSADLILRHYVGPTARAQSFLGVGVGASSATPDGDSAQPALHALSLACEAGRQWQWNHGWLGFLRVQARRLQQGPARWSNWGLTAGVGIPLR